MMTSVTKDSAKTIATYDLSGKVNGLLLELFKDHEKTLAYMSITYPGAFKGYHLHRVRTARYICIKGTMTIILFIGGKFVRYILNVGDRLNIPKKIPTGLLNEGQEEAWLINYPDPPYDPSLTDEQMDYTEDELKRGVLK